MAGEEEGGTTLEYTPTWVVAIVCAIIVAISLGVERAIHYIGKYLKKTDKKPLYQALEKIKEELMLMGFISLLLTVFQSRIGGICVSEELANKWLPCDKNNQGQNGNSVSHAMTIPQLLRTTARHLLAEEQAQTSSCENGKVPMVSVTALHHLHIFIFALAVVHVVMCALTVLFGGIKISQWQQWEEATQKKEHDPEDDTKNNLFTLVEQHEFIKDRYRAVNYRMVGWLLAFFKQFYGSVTKADYITMRYGFIMMHLKRNHNFNFHRYMVRSFESDFKKVVGISWFLWLFVVVFLFVNVNGYHVYFYLAFIPLVLLLVVGTNLEHVIIKMAREVAQRHAVIIGDVEIQPSDKHFWFNRPRILLVLIHIILFQNSFEMAFFFWIWYQYGFNSCIMGSIGYTIPRIVVAVFVQLLCSYSTLPLYAIVTQMGTSFNKAIFEDHIQEGLMEWAHKAKRRTTVAKRLFANGSGTQAHSYSHQNGAPPKEATSMAMVENLTANIPKHDQDSGLPEIVQLEQLLSSQDVNENK